MLLNVSCFVKLIAQLYVHVCIFLMSTSNGKGCSKGSSFAAVTISWKLYHVEPYLSRTICCYFPVVLVPFWFCPISFSKCQLGSHFSVSADLFFPVSFSKLLRSYLYRLCPGISRWCFSMWVFFICMAFRWEVWVSLLLKDFSGIIFLIIYLFSWLSFEIIRSGV